MGMFGNSKSPWVIDESGAMSPSEGPKPRGRKAASIWGVIGDGLLGLAGQKGVYAPMMQQRREQEAEEARIAAAEARANRPQYHYGPNGQVDKIDPTTGELTTVRAGTPDAPKTTSLQQQVEYIRSLDPTITNEQAADMAQRALSGFAYSPEARQAKVADAITVADHRYGNSAALRSAPTYAQSHPRASGGGGAGKPTATRSLGGKVYRKIGGRWFED